MSAWEMMNKLGTKMNNRKLAQIDKEFEKTARQLYPFAKSLYQITKMMNERLKDELYGVNNAAKKKR